MRQRASPARGRDRPFSRRRRGKMPNRSRKDAGRGAPVRRYASLSDSTALRVLRPQPTCARLRQTRAPYFSPAPTASDVLMARVAVPVLFEQVDDHVLLLMCTRHAGAHERAPRADRHSKTPPRTDPALFHAPRSSGVITRVITQARSCLPFFARVKGSIDASVALSKVGRIPKTNRFAGIFFRKAHTGLRYACK